MGCPVLMVTGDVAACEEARGLLGPGLVTLPKPLHPYDPGSPCEIRVEYKNTLAPDKLRYRHGVECLSDRVTVSRADTWWEAWTRFFF